MAKVPYNRTSNNANTLNAAIAYVDDVLSNIDVEVDDATSDTKGLIRLAGDLAGSASSPSVVGLSDKADQGDLDALDTAYDAHAAATTSVHGIADTSVLATQSYVDALASGLSPHAPADTATTANITIASAGSSSIDGVSLVDGVTRILVKDQTNKAENGIYVRSGSGLARASDANSAGELKSGSQVTVIGGTTNQGTTWILSSPDDPLTIGTSLQTWYSNTPNNIEITSRKNQASGYAGLGSDTKLDATQMPATVAVVGNDTWLKLAFFNCEFAATPTYDANGAPISGSMRWSDGTTGAYTADSVSTVTDSGVTYSRVDAYSIVYGSRKVSQPAVTRNSDGDVIASPALVVTNVA